MLHRSMLDLEEWGQSAIGICLFFYMMKLIGVYVHSTICATAIRCSGVT